MRSPTPGPRSIVSKSTWSRRPWPTARSVVTEVQGKADHALAEYQYRRYWLAISLVPILIVIGLLVLYIRGLPIPEKPAEE